MCFTAVPFPVWVSWESNNMHRLAGCQAPRCRAWQRMFNEEGTHLSGLMPMEWMPQLP